MTEPKSITLTAQMDITAGPDAGDDGKPRLPLFTMVAYTGGPYRRHARRLGAERPARRGQTGRRRLRERCIPLHAARVRVRLRRG